MIDYPGLLVVIPCGQRKAATPLPAWQLYEGPYYTACLKWARALVPDHQIRILSAKHGFTPLDRLLEPYNVTFGRPGSISGLELLGQKYADTTLINANPVVVIGGSRYVHMARGIWPTALAPMSEMDPTKNRLGYQMQWLRSTKGRWAPPQAGA